MRTTLFILAAWLAALPLAGGCASAVAAGSVAALDSKDLTSMTDALAADLATEPRLAGTTPIVVVEPVQNRLRGEVLPTGQRQLFTARLRERLDDAAPERFVFVNNREVFLALVDSELDLGVPVDRVQPTHTLKGVFRSLAEETRQRRVAYYLCTFDLVDLATGQVVWAGQYEVKKAVARDYLD